MMVGVLSALRLLWGPSLLAHPAAASVAGSSAVRSGAYTTTGGGSTAVWASHPVASNQTLMLQIYGASTSSKVAVEKWSESTATWDSSTPLLIPESASASGLAVVMPGSVGNSGTKEYSAYRISVDGGKPMLVNTPEIWWALGDAGNSATNDGKGWVRLFGRSVALGGGPSKLKLTHSLDGHSVVIPMDQSFNHTGRYCAKFSIPAGLFAGD